MTARRKVERALKRLLEANTLEELFRGGLEERRITVQLLADLAGPGERYGKLARRAASRAGVTFRYLRDRVMVFTASISEIRSRDLFRRLGVPPSATLEEIRGRWREVVKETHPDTPGGDSEAFCKARTAYEALADPDRRARYDGYWARQVAPVEEAILLLAPAPGRWGRILKYRSAALAVLSRSAVFSLGWLRGMALRVRASSERAGAALGRCGRGGWRAVRLFLERVGRDCLGGLARASRRTALRCGHGTCARARKGLLGLAQMVEKARRRKGRGLAAISAGASAWGQRGQAAVLGRCRRCAVRLRLWGQGVLRLGARIRSWAAGAPKAERLRPAAAAAVFTIAFGLAVTFIRGWLSLVSDREGAPASAVFPAAPATRVQPAGEGVLAALLAGEQSQGADRPMVALTPPKTALADRSKIARWTPARGSAGRQDSAAAASAASALGNKNEPVTGAAPGTEEGGQSLPIPARAARALASAKIERGQSEGGRAGVRDLAGSAQVAKERKLEPRLQSLASGEQRRESSSAAPSGPGGAAAASESPPAGGRLQPVEENEAAPLRVARTGKAVLPPAPLAPRTRAPEQRPGQAPARVAQASAAASILAKEVTRDEVIGFLDLFRQSYEQLDWARLSALFAEEASENDMAGKDRIAAAYERAFGAMDRARYLLGKTEVHPLGPWADVRAPFTIAYRDAAGRYGEMAGQARWWLVRDRAGLKVLRLEYKIDHRAQ